MFPKTILPFLFILLILPGCSNESTANAPKSPPAFKTPEEIPAITTQPQTVRYGKDYFPPAFIFRIDSGLSWTAPPRDSAYQMVPDIDAAISVYQKDYSHLQFSLLILTQDNDRIQEVIGTLQAKGIEKFTLVTNPARHNDSIDR
jgi:hypothetical protein